jgi:serine/threonine-protein kinase HipA
LKRPSVLTRTIDAAVSCGVTDSVFRARELWRRLVFNLLITNVDDHLHNLGFLHVGQGRWALAPAFDLMKHADYFRLSEAQAMQVLSRVVDAVGRSRTVGASARAGLMAGELEEFASAFAYGQMKRSKALLG